MKYSYYPGCTLKNKAKDLTHMPELLRKHWASKWKRSKTGSAAAAYIPWAAMR